MPRSYSLLVVLLIPYALLSNYAYLSIALGWMYFPFFTSLTTLVGLTFTLLHAGQRQGWKNALLLFGLTFGVSLLFESVGVATGLIYGPYHYIGKLGPLFLGLVPYLIPVAWFLMMYPSYVLAERLIPARLAGWKRILVLATIAGLVMTAWDVVMDPGMVANGYWVWEVEGAYFGIPLQNYWGWWLTTFTVFLLYLLLARPRADTDTTAGASNALSPRFDRLVLFSYALTGLTDVLVALLGGMGGPALAGIFAMTPWVVMGWWRTDRSGSNDSL